MRDLVRRLLAAVTLLWAPSLAWPQASTVAPRITQAIDETKLTTLRGNTHPLARPQFDRGAAPASLPLERMLLILQRSAAQESALEALLQQQQDASSPSFHKWLTPQEFGLQFGPADQDIQTITSWLASHGFQVAGVSSGRTVIEFSGTAGQLQEAFHTTIHQYSINGKEQWANSSDPQIPTALTPVVAGINTLYNFPRQQMHERVGASWRARAAGAKTVGPLFTFPNPCSLTASPFCNFAVAPADFAKIYTVPNLLLSPLPATQFNGDGVTIAVVGQSDINPDDVTQFRAMFGLPAAKLNVILSGPDPGVNDAEIEADLDVQWSGAVAPNATIDLVLAQETEVALGADLAAQYAVDNNLAPVLSESFGICEFFMGTADNQFYNQLWQQAAAQGISVLASAGDAGSAVCDGNLGSQGPAQLGLTVSGVSSTPYNVAVGGTDFNQVNNPFSYWSSSNHATTLASALGYIPEMTWNNTCTNQEVFADFGTSTAEETCNNTNVQQDYSFLLDPIGGSGGKSSCTVSDFNPLTGEGDLTSCSGGYAKPSWQTALTPADGARDVPDVVLFASNGFNASFYVICEADIPPQYSLGSCGSTSQLVGLGGTSASTPTFAAILALVNQATKSRQGNANYILYKLAAQSGNTCTSAANPASTCVFYDVPAGSTIAMPCAQDSPDCTISTSGDTIGVLSGYATTTGYDLATGLGSVNATNLVTKWTNFALTPSSTSLTLNSGSPVSIRHGEPVNVAINVTGTGGTPTGNVSLIANTAPPSAPMEVTEQGVQAFALSSGSASGATSALPGGSYTVFAQYPGDGTFGASASTPPIPVTVTAEGSVTFANLVTLDINGFPTSFDASSATYGSGSFLFRVDVGNSSATLSAATGISSSCSKGLSSCPTGAITLTSTGTPLGVGSLNLNSRGYAEIQTLVPGTYAVSASYPGDSSYGPSSANANFTISKAATTASASVAGQQVQYGSNETIEGTVATTSDGVAPTGTLTFSVDGSTISPSNLVYTGSPYQPGTTPPAYATLSATGSTVFLSTGSHTLSVQYSGDANYAASTSGPTTVNVTQAQPTFTSWGANPSTTNLNQQVTLFAQMAGSNAGVAPTGTMTFSVDNQAVSGTITYTPTAHGLNASLPYNPTAAGTHKITVSYSGDSNYLPATTASAATLTVVASAFTLTASPTTVTVSAPGQTGSTTLTFTGQNGFSSNGSVMITPVCTGLPAASSCSSGASVNIPANGTAMASVVFSTTAPSTAVPSSRIRPDILGSGWTVLWVVVGLACITGLGELLLGYRGRRLHWVGRIILAAGCFAAVGCGGGGGSSAPTNPGTPPGQTTPTVSVTINGVTETVTVTLIVNP
jgi:hypothetical protein